MSIDTGPLLVKIAEWAERLEGEFGETAELVDAMLIVEVSHSEHDLVPEGARVTPSDDGADDVYSYVDYQVLSNRDVVARGLLDRVDGMLH
jgi:hypothetical protein